MLGVDPLKGLFHVLTQRLVPPHEVSRLRRQPGAPLGGAPDLPFEERYSREVSMSA